LASFSAAVILFHGFSGARAYSAAAARAAASLASFVFIIGLSFPEKPWNKMTAAEKAAKKEKDA
jgi:dienelactone hydrolase